MSQKINYHARTESQIPLMSNKLTDVVGDLVFPFSNKKERLEFFSQMLQDLLHLTSTRKHYLVASWALETIKALLSKLD